MNNIPQALLLIAASLSPAWVAAADPVPAQDAAPQAQQPAANAPDIGEFDKQMDRMQENLQKMQAQMEKIQQTQDPNERQRLLQEHWNTLHQNMQTMRGMGGPGRMGGPMMGPGHRMGWQGYSNLTPEQQAQRQYMMDRRLEMQQQMMDQMMLHQQYRGNPPAQPAQ
ncbi:hypothetical protein [Pseudomonas sp. RL]|uniref:hypothetical protein n=1 Tax=Pseudomonas sp. RL TaxID=1452718 RepID=UPI000487C563|nr:hypothetical protein [Pseudomonas sp. RL]